MDEFDQRNRKTQPMATFYSSLLYKTFTLLTSQHMRLRCMRTELL